MSLMANTEPGYFPMENKEFSLFTWDYGHGIAE